MAYAYAHVHGPLYGYSQSTTDPATGYTYTHAVYTDAYGDYERVFDEERGPAFDRTYQATYSDDGGVVETDILQTATPLDGTYATYGTRSTDTYDLYDHTATRVEVTFSAGYAYTTFYSIDYDTGATVASADTRWFYAGGSYEYTSSTYEGPGGTNSTAGGAYHYASL